MLSANKPPIITKDTQVVVALKEIGYGFAAKKLPMIQYNIILNKHIRHMLDKYVFMGPEGLLGVEHYAQYSTKDKKN